MSVLSNLIRNSVKCSSCEKRANNKDSVSLKIYDSIICLLILFLIWSSILIFKSTQYYFFYVSNVFVAYKLILYVNCYLIFFYLSFKANFKSVTLCFRIFFYNKKVYCCIRIYKSMTLLETELYYRVLIYLVTCNF